MSVIPVGLACFSAPEREREIPRMRAAKIESGTRTSRFTMQMLDPVTALEATQGQTDGVFSQLAYKCHLEKVEPVGD